MSNNKIVQNSATVQIELRQKFLNSDNILTELLSQIPSNIKINISKFQLLENNLYKLHDSNKQLVIDSLKDKCLEIFKHNKLMKNAEPEYMNALFTLALWVNIAKIRSSKTVPNQMKLKYLKDKLFKS